MFGILDSKVVYELLLSYAECNIQVITVIYLQENNLIRYLYRQTSNDLYQFHPAQQR